MVLMLDFPRLNHQDIASISIGRQRTGLEVALQAGEFGAFDGTVAEESAELGLIHLGDALACQREKVVGGLQFGNDGGASMAVVGTTLLALVATKDAVAQHARHPLRQVATVLDGEARQATAGIDGPVITQCPRRASLDARMTLATRLCAWCIGIK